jgi:hypothetical protein
MDDFLYNLRNSANNKRHDGNRKQYGNYNRNYDRNRGKDGKGGFHPRGVHQEYLPLLKKAIYEISESYKRMAEAGERRAVAEERQAIALEKIGSAILGESIMSDDEAAETVPADKTVDPETKAEADAKDESSDTDEASITADADQDTIRKAILAMRRDKVSYDKIAKFLTEKGIPTFSGRGQWRGQLVSRLCRQ